MSWGSASAGQREASQPKAVSAVPSLGHRVGSHFFALLPQHPFQSQCGSPAAQHVVLQPSCWEWAPLDGAGLFISSAREGTAYNSSHVLHQQITWSRVFKF